MDKPTMYKDELEKKSNSKRHGLQKHIYLDFDIDKAISKYAKKLKLSQSEVIERIYYNGIEKFERQHGFRLTENIPLETNAKSIEMITNEFNERYKKIIDYKKRNSAETANKLSNAYMKKVLFDWSEEGSKDWNTI